MAEGKEEVQAGKEESMQIDDSQRTEDYVRLLEAGLDQNVALKLDDIYKTGRTEAIHLLVVTLYCRRFITYLVCNFPDSC